LLGLQDWLEHRKCFLQLPFFSYEVGLTAIWPDSNLKGIHRRATKHLSAIMKESESILERRSWITAWVVIHLNVMTHIFLLWEPILTMQVLKLSTPVE
jgi:hypothetical protein